MPTPNYTKRQTLCCLLAQYEAAVIERAAAQKVMDEMYVAMQNLVEE
jgi:hypothetical protein